jgi:hypothetical protein
MALHSQTLTLLYQAPVKQGLRKAYQLHSNPMFRHNCGYYAASMADWPLKALQSAQKRRDEASKAFPSPIFPVSPA